MKTATITDNDWDNCIDGAKHELVPARQRGRKVRFRCNVCTRLTGWQKQTGTITEKEPVGTITHDYDLWTVPDLRLAAKERGIIGYSKMKKADLIDALVDTDNLVTV